MPDEDLAKALYGKYYSDIPYDQFRSKFIGEPQTFMGNVREGVRGVIPGAVGTVLGGLEGIAGLVEHGAGIDRGKGVVTRNLRSAIEGVDEEFKPEPGYETSWGRQIGSGAGSILGFAATGGLGGLAAKGLGLAGKGP